MMAHRSQRACSPARSIRCVADQLKTHDTEGEVELRAAGASEPARKSSCMATADAPAPTVGAPDYVEVYDEPLHPTVFQNEYVRVLKIRNETVGKEPFEAKLEAGSFYWGDHLANPIIHKICVGKHDLDCMDVEFNEDRPKPASLSPTLPNVASKRDLCFENDVVRAYRVNIVKGESIAEVLADADAAEARGGGLEGVGFSYLAIALKSAKLSRGEVKAGDSWWCGGGADDTWSNAGEQVEVMILQPK